MTKTNKFKKDTKWTITEEIHELNLPGISDILAGILSSRGFDEKEAHRFLFSEYKDLSDPFLIEGMKEGVTLIEKSIKKREKIAVYGDYDADGVTATAILIKFFSDIGVEVVAYIPSRDGEGYGLNKKAIKELFGKGVNLIITVDCGTNAKEEIDYAKKLGMKIVITDHHEPEKLSVKPDALINPKRQAMKSFSNLAGAGVSFYLVRALQSKFADRFPLGQEKWLLDLVAIGTVCDVVPLVGDNRILVKYGLIVLSKGRNIGLNALAQKAGFDISSIDTYRIGFVLGPRLNAAGRLENAQMSLELLITGDSGKANQISEKLNSLNEERQIITERIVEEAKELIDSMDGQNIYLLANRNWPAGIVGIAASRLVEEYGRPVLIMEDSGESLKGSARSIKGFDIVRALSACKECFIKYGGHAAAAGFTLKKENLSLLNEKLIAIADAEIGSMQLSEEIKIEGKIAPKELTIKLAEEISLMEPFGVGNPKPLFMAEELIVRKAELIGKNKNHLKMSLEKEKVKGLPAITFHYGGECSIVSGDKISLVYSLEINEWNNSKKIDLRVFDMKLNKYVEQNVDRKNVITA